MPPPSNGSFLSANGLLSDPQQSFSMSSKAASVSGASSQSASTYAAKAQEKALAAKLLHGSFALRRGSEAGGSDYGGGEIHLIH